MTLWQVRVEQSPGGEHMSDMFSVQLRCFRAACSLPGATYKTPTYK